MTRLDQAVNKLRDAGRPALVPFLTAGYPDRETFRRLMAEVAAAGCTVLEIGVPFSDPVADGPAIQEASRLALADGMTLVDAIALAGEAEREHGLAVVLMGYINPVLSFGAEAFADACANARVAGIIVPDLPLEEADGLRDVLATREISLVDLVAPTSGEDRLAAYGARASGFLYLVSTTGVTGAGVGANLGDYVARVRPHADVPLYVGFGISSPEAAADVGAVADGAVVGSALLRLIADADGADEAVTAVGDFLRAAHEAMAARRDG